MPIVYFWFWSRLRRHLFPFLFFNDNIWQVSVVAARVLLPLRMVSFWWWRHGCRCLSGWQNLVVAAARVSLPCGMASFGEDRVGDVVMEQADIRSSVVHGTTPCTSNPTLGVDHAPRGFVNGGGAKPPPLFGRRTHAECAANASRCEHVHGGRGLAVTRA